MIETKWFLGTDDLTDAHYIRRTVFIDEQGVDESIEMDGTDESCVHLVIYADNTPAATARVMITADEFIIGRVAVLPAYRGLHLGGLAVRMLIRASYNMGGDKQVVHAQTAVRGFYEKLGFTAYGSEYETAGIPHINMEHIGDCGVTCSECQSSKRCMERNEPI